MSAARPCARRRSRAPAANRPTSSPRPLSASAAATIGCSPARRWRRWRRAIAATPRAARPARAPVRWWPANSARRSRVTAASRSPLVIADAMAQVPLQKLVSRLRRDPRRRTASNRPTCSSPSVTFDERRHDHDGRQRVRRPVFDLLPNDGRHAVEALTASATDVPPNFITALTRLPRPTHLTHPTHPPYLTHPPCLPALPLHHSLPSRCISSALRIAAPAAPRIVLWPSATNL